MGPMRCHVSRQLRAVHLRRLCVSSSRAQGKEEAGVRRNAAGIELVPLKLWAHAFAGSSMGLQRAAASANGTHSSTDKAQTHEENLARAAAATAAKGKVEAAEKALSSEQPSLWGRMSEAMTPKYQEALERLEMPKLHGDNIVSHFDTLAAAQAEPYLLKVEELLELAAALPDLPHESGRQWSRQAGWTFYPSGRGQPRPVDAPSEDALVLDVEVAVQEAPFPVLATAVGPGGWYSWVSPRMAYELRLLAGDGDGMPGEEPPAPSLLNLEPLSLTDEERQKRRQEPSIVVGHNVAYDRARIREEYSMTPSKRGFLDTMSLHISVSGMSSRQRTEFLKLRAKRKGGLSKEEDKLSTVDGELDDGGTLDCDISAPDTDNPANAASCELESMPGWADVSSLSSLAECVKHWLKTEVNKDDRKVFVTGSYRDIAESFETSMNYCAMDVKHTLDLFAVMWPTCRENHLKHMASFMGMLEMGSAYLPVDEGFDRYRQRAEEVYQAYQKEAEEHLRELAVASLDLLENDAWKEDPHLRYLDWTVKETRYTKEKRNKQGEITQPSRPVKRQKLPGKPEWFKALWEGSNDEGSLKISPRKTAAPALYRMMWHDKKLDISFPLYYDAIHKWGYLVPKDVKHTPPNTVVRLPWVAPNGLDDHMHHDFYKLPHKDGEKARCGSPFAKDYISYIEKGTLRTEYPEVFDTLKKGVACSYWSSARDRIRRQFVVDESALDRETFLFDSSLDNSERKGLGAILPLLVPSGTISRRAVEDTWLTASNPKATRVGSELKAMVCAPPGCKLVGADVDSQELWIAAVLGDADFAQMHGGTPFGWMTLQGNKADKTDMHSKTANILGISRDEAKIFNYGRIYGAGSRFATLLLQQFNPHLTSAEAQARTLELYEKTKGVKVAEGLALTRRDAEKRRARTLGIDDDAPRTQSISSRGKRASTKRSGQQGPSRKLWEGGSESAMFNRLEEIGTTDMPETPVLGFKITAALQPRHFLLGQNHYLTSRINWVVQSSAVDYLHLMLVSMRDLIERFDMKARLAITIHDEVRYIVAEEDAERFALALHLTNFYVRAMFAAKLGLNDLPYSVAFFSAVDVDHVLRKEVFLDCVTPSQPHPISPGMSLSFVDAVNATNGSLAKKRGA